MSIDHRGLFPALLKHWRGQRGLSQLDLALAADVSSRHLSFLETGRSSPSPEMVLRLAAALDVPLRQVDAMLQAAGHEAMYEPFERGGGVLPAEIRSALDLLKSHHEPFPLVVIDRRYDVVDLNRGATAVFTAAAPSLARSGEARVNLLRLTFDPNGAQPALVNFEEVGRALLWRVQREVLAARDESLRALLDEVLAMPTVSPRWREVDLSVPSSPALVVHLRTARHQLRFVTMVTAFQAPQAVELDELRIETWLPIDPETEAACRELVDALEGRPGEGDAGPAR